MRDVYLWTGLAVGSLIAAAAVVALVRRWLDWQDRRTATAPPVLHTEVWPRIQLPPARASLAPPEEPAPPRPMPVLGMAMLVNFVAVEAEIQHVLEWETQTARIWAEVDGIFSARGLVTV